MTPVSGTGPAVWALLVSTYPRDTALFLSFFPLSFIDSGPEPWSVKTASGTKQGPGIHGILDRVTGTYWGQSSGVMGQTAGKPTISTSFIIYLSSRLFGFMSASKAYLQMVENYFDCNNCSHILFFTFF